MDKNQVYFYDFEKQVTEFGIAVCALSLSYLGNQITSLGIIATSSS